MLSLAVKLDGIERRKRSTGLLHIAAGCFLLAKGVDYLVYYNYQKIGWAIPVFLVVLLSLVYGFMKKKFDPTAKFNHWMRLLQVCFFTILGIQFMSFGRQLDVIILIVWAIICTFLMFTERKVFHDLHMQFKPDGIFIPGYFKGLRLYWDEVGEVVARPDFITIFQKNEKYIQLELLNTETLSNLEKINIYCRQQIEQTKNKII